MFRPTESVTVERIDLATGAAVEVADGLHYQPNNMGPLLSADLRVVAGLDDELRSHVIDLATGADVELEPCEVVRAIDHSGRLALIDGQILCAEAIRSAALPGPACHSRVLDVRTGRTVLDLGARAMWSGVFGPLGRRRPARARRPPRQPRRGRGLPSAGRRPARHLRQH